MAEGKVNTKTDDLSDCLVIFKTRPTTNTVLYFIVSQFIQIGIRDTFDRHFKTPGEQVV